MDNNLLEYLKSLRTTSIAPKPPLNPMVSKPEMDDNAPVEPQPAMPEQNAFIPPENDVQSLLNKYNELKAPQDQLLNKPFGDDLDDNAIKAALKLRDSSQLGINLGKAATTLGAAIAGVKPQYGIYDDLSKQAEQPVTDLLARRKAKSDEVEQTTKMMKLAEEKASVDPNSLESQIARDLVKSFKPGTNISDNTPAATLYKVLPMLKSAVDAKSPFIFGPPDANGNVMVMDKRTGQVMPAGYTKESTVFQVKDPLTGEVKLVNRRAGGPGKGAEIQASVGVPEQVTGKEQSSSDLFKTLNAKQRESVQSNTEKYLKDTEKNRDAVTAAQSVRNMLSAGEDGRLQYDSIRALQNQLARGSGEVGAMTDRDVNAFGGRANILGRLERFLTMETIGQLPQEDRKFLTELTRVMEDNAIKALTTQAKPYIANISRDTGRNEADSSSLLNLPASQAMQEKRSGIKIRRKSDGMIKVVDQATAQKILKDSKYEQVQ